MITSFALLLASAQTTPMPSSYNGVWISPEGFAFTIVSPYTIWTTLDHSHFSAYQVNVETGGGFSGKFDASRTMRPGQDPDPQISSQYDLLNDASTSFPSKPEIPGDLPVIQKPSTAQTDQYGTVTIKSGPSDLILHMDWTDARGAKDFAGNVTKVGGDEVIDMNGLFVDRELKISIADVGKGPKQTLVGTATLSGAKYKLKGLRVWGRGVFNLYGQTGDSVLGRGWIEWEPSPKFCQALANGGKPGPTDRVMTYTQINSSTSGSTHLLVRDPSG